MRNGPVAVSTGWCLIPRRILRSEEHTSELQSRLHLVCRLLLEKKKNNTSCRATQVRTATERSARARAVTPGVEAVVRDLVVAFLRAAISVVLRERYAVALVTCY